MATVVERLAYWLAISALTIAAGYYLLGHEFTLYTAEGVEKVWAWWFDVNAADGAGAERSFTGQEQVQLVILSLFGTAVGLFGLASRAR